MPQLQRGPDGAVHSFPDDATPAEISDAMNSAYPAPGAMAGSMARTHGGSIMERLRDFGLNALPAGGGLLGGAVGAGGGLLTSPVTGPAGPVAGAVEGASWGGAGGEALRQLVSRALGLRAPATPGAAASSIGAEGAKQGAMQLAGEGVAAGARAAAPPLMRGALRVTGALQDRFPGVDFARTALKNRLPVGGILGGIRGSTAARQAVSASSAELGQKLATSPAWFTFADVMQPVLDRAEEAAGRPLTSKESRAVLERAWAKLSEGPYSDLAPKFKPLEKFSAEDVQAMKKRAQDLADEAYAASGRSKAITPSRQYLMDLASGPQRALEWAIPGVSDQNANTQALIGTRRAIRAAEARRAPIAIPALAGVAASAMGGAPAEMAAKDFGAFLVARGLMSPQVTSRAALMANNPLFQGIAAQAPRAAAALLSPPASEPDATARASDAGRALAGHRWGRATR